MRGEAERYMLGKERKRELEKRGGGDQVGKQQRETGEEREVKRAEEGGRKEV